ncbi:hypothetical protein HDU86_000500, partial [Geranomyces michiganensis]
VKVPHGNGGGGAVTQRYYYRRAKESAAACKKKNDDADYSETSNSALPIVFIHGIGIGFLHYASLIARFPTTVDVFLIDWPHVAMRRTDRIPDIPTTVNAIATMLTTSPNNHTRAAFVGHSLGTACISWMLHHKPDIVASTVFLDPVVFLLVDPSVAYNFVYRPPTTVLELLMHYFVARELYIAHSLARHFNWSQNILFSDDLPAATTTTTTTTTPSPPTTVVLSAWDQIVPSAAVRKYLTDPAAGATTPPVDLVWFDNMTHGQMMFDATCMDLVKKKVERACGLLSR